MAYILKHYDQNVIKFDLTEDFDGAVVRLIEIDAAHAHLVPLDMKPDNAGILRWLRRRTIPSNRAYVNNFLAKQGLNEKNTKGIIDISKGLSLNDAYWIVPDDFKGAFAQYNLYTNKFSRILGELAFLGYGSHTRSAFVSSPEFTTNGMLAKCWRRIDGEVILYKSGTEGAANLGKEPYSEFLAYQVAKEMDITAIKYGLVKWKGKLCSTCSLFTDMNTGFVPIGRLVTEGGIRAVMEYYKQLGGEYYEQLIDMLVFDAVICNTDRHFGNFGLLIDNRTNTILEPAPVFDNGLSLFCYAMNDDLSNIDRYAKTCQPAAYPEHVAFAKGVMTKRQRDKLRHLHGFRFTKHRRYNLPDERMKVIEDFIHRRVQKLLD